MIQQSAKRKPIAEMTDDELVAACQPMQEEKSFEAIGCGLAVAAVGVIVYIGYRYPGSEWFATFGGMVLGLIIAALIFVLPSGKKTQQYRQELERRHPFPTAEQAHETIKAEDGPDWMLLLTGHGLPHGNECHVEVSLWLADESAALIRRLQRTPTSMIDRRPFLFESGTAELDDAMSESLRTACSNLDLAALQDARAMVIDGFPCTVTAIRKRPFGTSQGKCNLSGISPDEAELPVPKLAVLLWEAAQAVPMTSSIIGSCDFRGNVRIEGH